MNDHTSPLKPSTLVRFAGEGARLGMFLSIGMACARMVFEGAGWLDAFHSDERFLYSYLQTIIGCALASTLLSVTLVSIRDEQTAVIRLIRLLIQVVFLLAYTGAAAGAVSLCVMRIAVEFIH